MFPYYVNAIPFYERGVRDGVRTYSSRLMDNRVNRSTFSATFLYISIGLQEAKLTNFIHQFIVMLVFQYHHSCELCRILLVILMLTSKSLFSEKLRTS